ncbi:MAG: hypothetical protein H7228_12425 [Polaromonas sp.]|nr:hypothetical protein [Polaromonas sp.]
MAFVALNAVIFAYPARADAVSWAAQQKGEDSMGLMDRDYMKDTGCDRPFSPPPESQLTGWPVKLLIFACLVYLGFKLAYWLDHRAKPTPAKAVVSAGPAPEPRSPQAAARPNLPQTPSYPPLTEAPAESGTVTKCVVSGKTSYGDSNCAAGAVASKVVTRTNQNLIAAVPVPPSAQTTAPAPASTAVAQANPGPDYAALKAECAWLDAHIKYLDDLARQPNSAQTQDRIREERKVARDRQFRIRCQ